MKQRISSIILCRIHSISSSTIVNILYKVVFVCCRHSRIVSHLIPCVPTRGTYAQALNSAGMPRLKNEQSLRTPAQITPHTYIHISLSLLPNIRKNTHYKTNAPHFSMRPGLPLLLCGWGKAHKTALASYNDVRYVPNKERNRSHSIQTAKHQTKTPCHHFTTISPMRRRRRRQMHSI